jgi:hypothetical protein
MKLQDKYRKLLIDLHSDVGDDYIVYALKKMVDQQMLFMTPPRWNADFQPVLKVLSQVIEEMEAVLFDPDEGVQNNEELKQLISIGFQWILNDDLKSNC